MLRVRQRGRLRKLLQTDSLSSMLTVHVAGLTWRRMVRMRLSSIRARGVAYVALGLAMLASSAPAQSLSTLALPQRVRLSAPELALRNYRGTWSRLNGDTLVVDDRRVSIRHLTALAVREGSASHWRWGAVLGATAGAVWGGLECRRSNCQEADLPVHFSVLTAAAGALVGVIVGAGVRTERWRAVSFSVRTGN